jgi:hypothetical protein
MMRPKPEPLHGKVRCTIGRCRRGRGRFAERPARNAKAFELRGTFPGGRHAAQEGETPAMRFTGQDFQAADMPARRPVAAVIPASRRPWSRPYGIFLLPEIRG